MAWLAAAGGGGTVQVGHAERSSSTQAIGTGSFTAISFDTEVLDNNAMVDVGGANPERVTAATAGKYLLNASAIFAANATNVRALRIMKNGATELARVTGEGFTGADNAFNCAVIDDASATDYYTAEVFQDSGGDLNLVASASNFLSAFRLDPS